MNRRWLKFVAIALSIAALIITATPAQASQQGRIYKDQSGAIFIYGLEPRQTIETGRDFAPARFITSNACGLLIVRRSKTQAVGRIRVEGQVLSDAALPTQLLPTCKDGQLAETRSQPFRTATGDVIVPLARNRRYQVSMLDRRQLRSVRANACGFVRMPSDSLGEKPLLPTTAGSVARFAIADLPIGEQILCQRREFYRPASFPPPLAVAMSDQTIVDAGGSGGSSGTGGQTPPQNTPPTISGLPDRIELRGNPATISFSVSDPNASVSVESLNSSAIQSAVVGGSGISRTITITPNRNYQGSAPIRLTVGSGSATSTRTFEAMLFSPSSNLSMAFCRIPNGFLAGGLHSGQSYELGFDDMSDSYFATANDSGVAEFNVNPIPDNEWSDGIRGIYLYNQDWDVIRQAPLPEVGNCQL